MIAGRPLRGRVPDGHCRAGSRYDCAIAESAKIINALLAKFGRPFLGNPASNWRATGLPPCLLALRRVALRRAHSNESPAATSFRAPWSMGSLKQRPLECAHDCHPCFARVLAAFRAAADRPAAPFVRAAFLAAAERSARLRRFAAEVACFERDLLEAAPRPSLCNALVVAFDRLADGFVGPAAPRFNSRSACCRVFWETLPFVGGGSLTPARRAFDSPMAMACLVERAPCSPSRMCSISSRTNSPAWVLGDLPSRLSRSARFNVSRSGISTKASPHYRQGCGEWSCRIPSKSMAPTGPLNPHRPPRRSHKELR
jgi:hypothetical protein